MASRSFRQQQYTAEIGIVTLYGSFTTSTSGTISTSSCKGFSIAKTATKAGRYTVTLEDKYQGLRRCEVDVVGATDAAYTTAKGLTRFLRNVAVDSTKTMDIQFARTDTAADAELDDGATVYIAITLKNSTSW